MACSVGGMSLLRVGAIDAGLCIDIGLANGNDRFCVGQIHERR
jgi:hypothetical protein